MHILTDYEIADTPLKRFVGLMFTRRQKKHLLFIFPYESRSLCAIHSFFCPEFDAIFLDKNKNVVDSYSVKPNSFIIPIKPAKYLIEAKKGYIKKNKIKEGDVFEF